MAFIRRYQPTDHESMIHVFRETASPELRAAGDAALHPASFIWCRPYLSLSSASSAVADCFVIDNGKGQVVGYVIGTADTRKFVRHFRTKFLPQVESTGQVLPLKKGEDTEWTAENLPNALRHILFSPEMMLHEEEPQLMENYPAHLHIDILSEYQRKGFGRLLIDKFCDTIHKERAATGLHLIVAGDNIEAGKFYSRIGFERYPRIIDGGKSEELGKEVSGSIWQVKNF